MPPHRLALGLLADLVQLGCFFHPHPWWLHLLPAHRRDRASHWLGLSLLGELLLAERT